LYETELKSQQNKPGKNQIRRNFSILSAIMLPKGSYDFPRPRASSQTFPSAEKRQYSRGLAGFIIKVPINPGVKHKMNLTFYVIKTKGPEFGLDTEAGGRHPQQK
jgi:hypothetical protein